MASFKAKGVKTVSTGKVEFRVKVGTFLDNNQETFKAELMEEGYTEEMATKIIDAVLGQVFGFLTGPDKD
jgi:hypothetical protein